MAPPPNGDMPERLLQLPEAQEGGLLYKKEEILGTIKTIYHEHSGVDGYRSMQVFLKRKGYQLSRTTVHKYMNRELKLFSVVRRKRPGYTHGKPHKVFENLIKQDFSSDAANRKWCTDFTFLYLADGNVRYNCSIIDLSR